MTDDALGCADGFHDVLVSLPPVDDGDNVTIDYECPRCGRVVATESWTKAAWRAQQGRPPRRPE
jgi:hypothetical protein